MRSRTFEPLHFAIMISVGIAAILSGDYAVLGTEMKLAADAAAEL